MQGSGTPQITTAATDIQDPQSLNAITPRTTPRGSPYHSPDRVNPKTRGCHPLRRMHTLPNQRESQSCFIVMWSGRGSLSNRICTCTGRLHQGGQDTPGGWDLPHGPPLTCCRDSPSRWHRTLRRCRICARTEHLTYFCCEGHRGLGGCGGLQGPHTALPGVCRDPHSPAAWPCSCPCWSYGGKRKGHVSRVSRVGGHAQSPPCPLPTPLRGCSPRTHLSFSRQSETCSS